MPRYTSGAILRFSRVLRVRRRAVRHGYGMGPSVQWAGGAWVFGTEVLWATQVTLALRAEWTRLAALIQSVAQVRVSTKG